ncbi:MAG TPA: TetR family transcriptional regulator C-terminal domain-containing protein [Usitatibacter sp.]|nr:TetR family transcriptional regulator C-terminal domain-containing protein [Usitatibacter sp.]
MESDVRERLLRQGMAMLLRHGYHDLGVNALLEATSTPKGSFYHYFKSKEQFGLEAIDLYMAEAHAGLDMCLNDRKRKPLARVRRFFELTEEKYRTEGYLGCLLGGLGQELSGVSDAFRRKVEECFTSIGARIAACLQLAVDSGELPKGTDTQRMATLLINCWEGAALRCRLLRDPAPLRQMLDFYFSAARA